MAKRKRLSLPVISKPGDHFSAADLVAPDRAPIAQVTGDAATHAALSDLAAEMEAARREGRLIQTLPLETIQVDYLTRDRVINNPEDMVALKASLQSRGQQAPIEVVTTKDGRYGLISGYRRLQALAELHSQTGEARFAVVQALIKPIKNASESYVAMVEENEIRANLSFYERARLAAEAVRLGVYPTSARAVQVLFANASSAKRSKINNFVQVHDAFGFVLRFPETIPEKLGLALASGLQIDSSLERRLCDTLRKARPEDASAERAVLERALRKVPGSIAKLKTEMFGSVQLEIRAGRVVLSGHGVTDALISDLRAWLLKRK